jgi:hypothetical protein
VDKDDGIRGYMWLNPDKNSGKMTVEGKIPDLNKIVLDVTDRVVIKVLVPKADLEHAKNHSGEAFTYYCTALGVTKNQPRTIDWDEVPVYDENYYYFELPAIGAGEFDTELAIFSSVFSAITKQSVSLIAEKGAEYYAESDPEAAAMFNALLDYGKATVEGTTALDHFDADAVAALAIPSAVRPVKGEGAINFTNVTLLMGDTLGIRFKADGAITGATVKFNGTELAADQFAIGENCVDLYVSAATLLNPIPVEIYDENGILCASFGYSVAGIANSIYTADNTNLKAAAILNLIAAVENYIA